ncbi:hypothetical protein MMC34_004457 [Xylographa carneopallida]|nr:hypothetical protein [Xylographa carneopallida]
MAKREKTEDQFRAEGASTELVGLTNITATPNQQELANPRQAQPSREFSFLDVFSKDVRKQTALAAFMMAMQQLSSINGILYVSENLEFLLLIFHPDISQYAPLLFEQDGLASAEASSLAFGVSAIVIFAVSIPALFLSDKVGSPLQHHLRRSRPHSHHARIPLHPYIQTRHHPSPISISHTSSPPPTHLPLHPSIPNPTNPSSHSGFLIGTLHAPSLVHPTRGPTTLGRRHEHLPFRHHLLRLVGGRHQAVRGGDPAAAHGRNWVAGFAPVLRDRSAFDAYILFGACAALGKWRRGGP